MERHVPKFASVLFHNKSLNPSIERNPIAPSAPQAIETTLDNLVKVPRGEPAHA